MAAPVREESECVLAVKMRMLMLCVCFCILINGVVSEKQVSCDALYRQGVRAYLDEKWQDCIDNIEQALADYRSLKQMTVNCRLKCQVEADRSSFMSPFNEDDLQFYEKMIRKTLCLLKCGNHKHRNGQFGIPKEAEKDFEDLKPYEYLQLCYYQKNMLQKAASAVFTYLASNEDNKIMLDNMKFYSGLPEVNVDELVNFEAKSYVSLYNYGSDAYQQEDYFSVIKFMEDSLLEYFRSEEECRALCEGPFDQGWFPDFVSSIANHFTFCLKCKTRCPEKLKLLNGEKHDDLLASHFNFLQFAYYKVGDMKKACEAVASYLIFFPADEFMLKNKEYYSKLPKTNPTYFTPRKEVLRYVGRQEYETKLLEFIESEFAYQARSKKAINNHKTKFQLGDLFLVGTTSTAKHLHSKSLNDKIEL